MKHENVKLLMQQKVSLYCNEKNFISHGKLLAEAKRIMLHWCEVYTKLKVSKVVKFWTTLCNFGILCVTLKNFGILWNEKIMFKIIFN